MRKALISLFSLWKETLSAALFAAIVATESLYRSPLYQAGVDFIIDWQQNHRSVHWDNFFWLVSLFGQPAGVGALFIILYNLLPRRSLLHMCLAFFVGQTVLSFFKEFYHAPRPYFDSPKVEAIECAAGYGNPSGHGVIVPGVYIALWLILGPATRRVLAIYLACTFLLWALIVFVFFARIYLGVHSLNQILYGTLFGFWAGFTCGFFVYRVVDSHFDFVMFHGDNQFVPTIGGVGVVAVTLALQGVNAALYVALSGTEAQLDPQWVPNIKRKCPDVLATSDPLLESFKGVLQATLYPFVYFYQLFSSRYLKAAFFRWGDYSVGPVRIILRQGLTAGAMAICFIPFFVTSKSTELVPVVVGIMVSNVLAASVGLLAIDLLSVRLGLVAPEPKRNEEDGRVRKVVSAV